MIAFGLRAALSGLIVAAVALIARRSPAAGALVASLPLVSLLGMIWSWRDTGDAARLATLRRRPSGVCCLRFPCS